MNVHEVAGLLAYFGSAWPKMELPDDTADVWAMELADVNADDGRAAAKNLVQSLTFFPSIAEFLAECRRVATARRATPPVRALPAPTEPADLPSEEIAKMRGQLAGFTIAPKRAESREPVVLPKARCPRCGEMTIPYTTTLEPKDVEPMQPYGEAYPPEHA